MTIKCKSAPKPKTNKLAAFGLVVLATILALYIKEDRSTMADTFNYYGNLTTKQTFNYPEEIELWSFGKMTTASRDVDFVIQLWCRPLGSNVAEELIETRVNQIKDYSFGNKLPVHVSEKIIKSVSVSGQIGQIDRELIRKQHKVTPYFSWDFNNIRPQESSTCHSLVTPNVYTPIFKIRKNAKFIGHEFDYYVPEEVSARI